MKEWLKLGPQYLKTIISGLYSNFTTRRLVLGVVFFLATTLLVGLEVFPHPMALEVNQPSPKDFLAPRSVTYASEVLTSEAKDLVGRQVEPLYRIDNKALTTMEENVDQSLKAINDTIVQNPSSQAAQRVKELLEDQLSLHEAEAVVAAGEDTREAVGEQLKEKLRMDLGRGISEEGLESARSLLIQQVDDLDIHSSLKPFARVLISRLELMPSLVYDVEGTRLRVQEAQSKVQPIQVTIRSGEKIVGRGELVHSRDIEALQRSGLLRQAPNITSFAGVLLLVGLLYALLTFYLLAYKKQVLEQEPKFILLGLLLVLSVGLGRGTMAIEIGGGAEMTSLAGYLIPTAASSMLIAILLGNRLALFCTIMFGLFTGIMTGQLAFATVAAAGGVTGIYSVSHLSQRMDLAKASIYIALTNIAAIGGMGLIQGTAAPTILLGMVMGLLNGVISSVLTIGSLPFLESAFGITSAIKLLELANPGQPLQRRLLLEAPGTYHHSIMVGNLAEAAANALGADSLLVRVGCYYHDIGKLKRPVFFVENQMVGENPHDKLTPNLSTLIITAHIKDGIEMARENKLPPAIIDIIAQHHGSSMVTYFYHKATEMEGSKNVTPEEFRYDSPKPQSREAAIVMLADSVEASARSLQKPSPGKLEGTVRKIIRDKLADGQLEECALTFKDLDIIAQAFTRSLSGFFHSRVEYPEIVLKEMERRKLRDVFIRKQSTG